MKPKFDPDQAPTVAPASHAVSRFMRRDEVSDLHILIDEIVDEIAPLLTAPVTTQQVARVCIDRLDKATRDRFDTTMAGIVVKRIAEKVNGTTDFEVDRSPRFW